MSGFLSRAPLAVLFLALPAAGSAPLTRIIVPGNVVVSSYLIPSTTPPRKTGRGLTATFRVERSSAARAIPSEAMGGACLIADLNPFGTPRRGVCTTDEQCAASLSPGQRANGWYSYCVVEFDRITAQGKTPKGKCWTRPGPPPSYCTMATDSPWKDGIDVRVPAKGVAPLYSPWSTGAEVRWRVRACLNGIDGQGGPPCKGFPGTKLNADGPALTVPK